MWELQQYESMSIGFMWLTIGTRTGSFEKKKSHKLGTSIKGRELFNQVC